MVCMLGLRWMAVCSPFLRLLHENGVTNDEALGCCVGTYGASWGKRMRSLAYYLAVVAPMDGNVLNFVPRRTPNEKCFAVAWTTMDDWLIYSGAV